MDPASGQRTFYPTKWYISAIAQDSQGKWWFAVSGGALGYIEGEVLRVSQSPLFSPVTLVRCLAIDQAGRKWLGTSKGLACFEGNRWKTYTERDGLPGNLVQAIAPDHEGGLWVATRAGLCYYDGKTWKVHTENEALRDKHVYKIAVTPDGYTLFGLFGTSRGVCGFDGETWKVYKDWKEALANCNFERGTNISIAPDIAIGHDGRILLMRYGSVLCYDGKTWRTYSEDDAPLLRCMAIDTQGRLWFGTARDGVRCFDGDTWKTYKEENALPGQWVHAAAVDRDGRKWFGTSWHVCSFDGKSWKTYGRKDVLKYRYHNKRTLFPVTCLASGPDGRVWAVANSRLCSFDGESWKVYPSVRDVLALAIDRHGRIWLGKENGVGLFDGATLTRVPEHGLPATRVRALAFDAEARLWAAFWPRTTEEQEGGGVGRFDGKSWTTYTEEDGLASDRVTSIVCDREGRVWFGTKRSGASRFDGETWKTYASADGLGSNRVHALAVDPENRIWFGCQPEGGSPVELGGVSCFDGKNWRTWNSGGLFVEDTVKCLAVDLDGSIWAGTKSGVSHIVLEKD